MRKTNLSGFLCLAATAFTLLSQGCTPDKTYDLKNVDTEVTVLKGVSVPLPNFKEVKLNDLLSQAASSDGSVIKETAQGDYVISVTMDPASIDGFKIDSDVITLHSEGGQAWNSPNSTTIPAGVTAATILSVPGIEQYLSQSIVDFSFNTDFSIPDFPKEVASIKSCSLSGTLQVSIKPSGIPFSKLTLQSGTRLVFPEFIVLGATNTAGFQIENGNVLKAVSDVAIPVGTGLTIGLTLSGLDFGANGKSPNAQGLLDISGSVNVEGGNISIAPNDFSGNGQAQSFDLKLAFGYTADITAVNSVTIKPGNDILPAIDQTYSFDLPDLSQYFSSDAQIELSDIQVLISLESQLPAQVTLSGKLRALKGKDESAVETHNYPIGPLAFAKESTTVYSLGTHADGIESGVIYKNVSGIGSILNPVPDRIEAYDFTAALANDWVQVNTNQTYGGNISVGLNAPLAFSANTRLGLSYDIKADLDLSSVSAGIPAIKGALAFTAVSTIPLTFGVKATALDADGKPMQGITSTVEGSINAGTIASPSSSNIVINLNLDTTKSIKGIRLELSASSDEAVQGTPLNKNQGLTLKDISVTFPDGVTVDIKEVTQNNKKN